MAISSVSIKTQEESGCQAPTYTNFRLAASMDPDSFAYSSHPFVDRLLDYALAESGHVKLGKDSGRKYLSEWLSILHVPSRIIGQLDTFRSNLPDKHSQISIPGLQTSMRCAISIGIDILNNDSRTDEFSWLVNKFNKMPKTGEPKEDFVRAYLKTHLPIQFEGGRSNIQMNEGLSLALTALYHRTYIQKTDLATLAIHAALIDPSNDIPTNYRLEWESKVNESLELLEMKIEGAIGFIGRLERDTTGIVSGRLQSEDGPEGAEGPIVNGGLCHSHVVIKGGVEDRDSIDMEGGTGRGPGHNGSEVHP